MITQLQSLKKPVSRPRIICLCGSTRFKKEFEEVNRILTLNGVIVLSVGVYGHSGDQFEEIQKEMLDELHLQKILLADEIFVINPGKYIGESTTREINFARRHGKTINYLESMVVVHDTQD